MGTTITIARRDLLSYFATPKASIVFFFFLVFMGWFFYTFVFMLMEMQSRAPMMGQSAPGVDQLIRAWFQNVHFILILVIPALTMGTFADERRAHTLRMLQTAPISSTEIVFGKFLSLAFVMSMVLLASAVFPLFLVLHSQPDYGQVGVAYLGVFLLMASQLSFGMWVSSMTENPFIAFVLTMAGLFLMLILTWLAGNAGGSSPYADFWKYLASSTHLENFLKGMITVEDVTYFLVFSGLFIFFSKVAIDSQRWR